MTRVRDIKCLDAAFAIGRLKRAVAFHELVALAAEHPDRVLDLDVMYTNVCLAFIAYIDAITVAFASVVTQKGHMAAVKLLHDSLGKGLPDTQELRIKRIFGRKDELSCGAGSGNHEDIQQAIEHLDAFAIWARQKLFERAITLDA